MEDGSRWCETARIHLRSCSSDPEHSDNVANENYQTSDSSRGILPGGGDHRYANLSTGESLNLRICGCEISNPIPPGELKESSAVAIAAAKTEHHVKAKKRRSHSPVVRFLQGRHRTDSSESVVSSPCDASVADRSSSVKSPSSSCSPSSSLTKAHVFFQRLLASPKARKRRSHDPKIVDGKLSQNESSLEKQEMFHSAARPHDSSYQDVNYHRVNLIARGPYASNTARFTEGATVVTAESLPASQCVHVPADRTTNNDDVAFRFPAEEGNLTPSATLNLGGRHLTTCCSPSSKKFIPRSPCRVDPDYLRISFVEPSNTRSLESPQFSMDEVFVDAHCHPQDQTESSSVKGHVKNSGQHGDDGHAAAEGKTSEGGSSQRDSIQEWVNSITPESAEDKDPFFVVHPRSGRECGHVPRQTSAEDDLLLGAEAKLLSFENGDKPPRENGVPLNLKAEPQSLERKDEGPGHQEPVAHGDAGKEAKPANRGHHNVMRKLYQLFQGESFESSCSQKTYESINQMLEERTGDPEVILSNLGFGNSEVSGSWASRVPRRFLFTPSNARGVDIADFIERNPELKEKLETAPPLSRGTPATAAESPGDTAATAKENTEVSEPVLSSLTCVQTKPPSHPQFAQIAHTATLLKRFSRNARRSAFAGRRSSCPKAVPVQCTSSAGNTYTSILQPENRKFLERQGVYDSVVRNLGHKESNKIKLLKIPAVDHQQAPDSVAHANGNLQLPRGALKLLRRQGNVGLDDNWESQSGVESSQRLGIRGPCLGSTSGPLSCGVERVVRPRVSFGTAPPLQTAAHLEPGVSLLEDDCSDPDPEVREFNKPLVGLLPRRFLSSLSILEDPECWASFTTTSEDFVSTEKRQMDGAMERSGDAAEMPAMVGNTDGEENNNNMDMQGLPDKDWLNDAAEDDNHDQIVPHYSSEGQDSARDGCGQVSSTLTTLREAGSSEGEGESELSNHANTDSVPASPCIVSATEYTPASSTESADVCEASEVRNTAMFTNIFQPTVFEEAEDEGEFKGETYEVRTEIPDSILKLDLAAKSLLVDDNDNTLFHEEGLVGVVRELLIKKKLQDMGIAEPQSVCTTELYLHGKTEDEHDVTGETPEVSSEANDINQALIFKSENPDLRGSDCHSKASDSDAPANGQYSKEDHLHNKSSLFFAFPCNDDGVERNLVREYEESCTDYMPWRRKKQHIKSALDADVKDSLTVEVSTCSPMAIAVEALDQESDVKDLAFTEATEFEDPVGLEVACNDDGVGHNLAREYEEFQDPVELEVANNVMRSPYFRGKKDDAVCSVDQMENSDDLSTYYYATKTYKSILDDDDLSLFAPKAQLDDFSVENVRQKLNNSSRESGVAHERSGQSLIGWLATAVSPVDLEAVVTARKEAGKDVTISTEPEKMMEVILKAKIEVKSEKGELEAVEEKVHEGPEAALSGEELQQTDLWLGQHRRAPELGARDRALQSFEIEEIQSAYLGPEDEVADRVAFPQTSRTQCKGSLLRTESGQSDSSGFAELDSEGPEKILSADKKHLESIPDSTVVDYDTAMTTSPDAAMLAGHVGGSDGSYSVNAVGRISLDSTACDSEAKTAARKTHYSDFPDQSDDWKAKVAKMEEPTIGAGSSPHRETICIKERLVAPDISNASATGVHTLQLNVPLVTTGEGQHQVFQSSVNFKPTSSSPGSEAKEKVEVADCVDGGTSVTVGCAAGPIQIDKISSSGNPPSQDPVTLGDARINKQTTADPSKSNLEGEPSPNHGGSPQGYHPNQGNVFMPHGSYYPFMYGYYPPQSGHSSEQESVSQKRAEEAMELDSTEPPSEKHPSAEQLPGYPGHFGYPGHPGQHGYQPGFPVVLYPGPNGTFYAGPPGMFHPGPQGIVQPGAPEMSRHEHPGGTTQAEPQEILQSGTPVSLPSGCPETVQQRAFQLGPPGATHPGPPGAFHPGPPGAFHPGAFYPGAFHPGPPGAFYPSAVPFHPAGQGAPPFGPQSNDQQYHVNNVQMHSDAFGGYYCNEGYMWSVPSEGHPNYGQGQRTEGQGRLPWRASEDDEHGHRILSAMLKTPSLKNPAQEKMTLNSAPSWPTSGNVSRRQHLVDEVKLMQHALQKYKVEFRSLDKRANTNYELAAADLVDSDEICQKGLDALADIRLALEREIGEMDRLLAIRMREIIASSSLSSRPTRGVSQDLASLQIIQQMIELLKEQVYHGNVIHSIEDEAEEATEDNALLEELGTTSNGHGGAIPKVASGSHLAQQMALIQRQIESQQSRTTATLQGQMKELRSVLVEEIRHSIHLETHQLRTQVESTGNQLNALKHTMHHPGTDSRAEADVHDDHSIHQRAAHRQSTPQGYHSTHQVALSGSSSGPQQEPGTQQAAAPAVHVEAEDGALPDDHEDEQR